jgi:23S rRNA (uracil1939-C5)-methyltransferase
MTEYKIIRLGHQGDGIADGPLFAPMTLPGEIVTGTPDGDTLKDVRIQTPSSDRVAAPCRHFKSCGGCQLQHASDDFVAKWKAEIVARSFAAHGLTPEIRPTLTSPAQSRQRATVAAKRTKSGAMVGFHGRASGTISEVPDCQLVDPKIKAGFPIAQELALIGTSRKAALAVSLTVTEDGLDVSVTGGKPLDGPLRSELAQMCDRTGLARLTWDGEAIAMRTPPRHAFGTAKVVVPAGGFLQATAHGAETLQKLVGEIVKGSKRVADLFAGSGTFALPLAQTHAVHAVEGDKAMIAALDQGWRMAVDLKPVTSEARDLFRRPLLPDELKKFDAVVLDPPRAGAVEQIKELVNSTVPVIAYVSCNPITFARDAAQLAEAGFVLEWVQPVDQFRWSSHVELVGSFRRENAKLEGPKLTIG